MGGSRVDRTPKGEVSNPEPPRRTRREPVGRQKIVCESDCAPHPVRNLRIMIRRGGAAPAAAVRRGHFFLAGVGGAGAGQCEPQGSHCGGPRRPQEGAISSGQRHGVDLCLLTLTRGDRNSLKRRATFKITAPGSRLRGHSLQCSVLLRAHSGGADERFIRGCC